MTRIDFYFNAPHKLQVACRIAAKAVAKQMRVLIIAPDEALSRDLEKMMWTTPATGFLPHCMSSDSLAAETPVVITRTLDTLPHDDLLLNLGTEPPVSFSRFRRLIEIVSSSDAEDKQQARDRFKFYKDRGYELHPHDLNLPNERQSHE